MYNLVIPRAMEKQLNRIPQQFRFSAFYPAFNNYRTTHTLEERSNWLARTTSIEYESVTIGFATRSMTPNSM